MTTDIVFWGVSAQTDLPPASARDTFVKWLLRNNFNPHGVIRWRWWKRWSAASKFYDRVGTDLWIMWPCGGESERHPSGRPPIPRVGWAPALQDHGVTVEFPCPSDIQSFEGAKSARREGGPIVLPFPAHASHLAGPRQPRDDKVLSPMEAREFLAGDVVVEEKSTARLGFRWMHGVLRAEPRELYRPRCATGTVEAAQTLVVCGAVLEEALRPELMLFGNGVMRCTACGIPDCRTGSWHSMCTIAQPVCSGAWTGGCVIEIAVVPELARGKRVEELTALLGARLTDGPAEGVYVWWRPMGNSRRGRGRACGVRTGHRGLWSKGGWR